jgi:hypothetical protein
MYIVHRLLRHTQSPYCTSGGWGGVVAGKKTGEGEGEEEATNARPLTTKAMDDATLVIMSPASFAREGEADGTDS